MIIAVDFDGTVVEHAYPLIGVPVPYAVNVLCHWTYNGHDLLLWTCREGADLEAAAAYMRNHGIPLMGINEQHPHSISTFGDGRKLLADLYIDDRAVGCPKTPSGHVDWLAINDLVAVHPANAV